MKQVLFFLLVFSIIFPISAQEARDTAKTSIAMLNYLATESTLIEKSKNNRMALDEIRRKIENVTNPSIVDIQTQGYLNNLLQSLTGMQLATIQREKLQFMYENEKAQVLSQSLPNPLYLLSMRNLDPIKLIATAALMTMDSFIRYKSASNSAEMKYLLGDLDLQAEDLKNLAELTGGYFNYMIDISRAYNLNVSESLNRDSIGNFINYILDDNLQRKCQWLEDNYSLYSNYGPYWLGMVHTYFDLGLYEKCLHAIQKYEDIQAPIFRKDYDFASALPKVILALSYIYGDTKAYQESVNRYLQKLIDNTSDSDWSLRYFAAQVYISLAGLINKDQNLTSAYNILLRNLVYLSREQDNLISQYLADIVDSRTLTGKQKKEEENINKELRKLRKTELPPLHSGLALHCQVLFPLMEELNKTSEQQIQAGGILSNTFVIPALKHKYLNYTYNYPSRLFNVSKNINGLGGFIVSPVVGVITVVSGLNEWKNLKLKIPASLLSSDSKIDINITGPESSYLRSDIDFDIKNVSRKGTTNIEEFTTELDINFDDTIIINKNSEYRLIFTIKTDGITCNVNFVSPVGKTDFSFLNID